MYNDITLYEDIKYGTNIITGEEYLETMLTLADVGAEMVVKTLGPFGKTTIIDDGSFTYPTKDGWSILKRLRFNDPIFNTLYGVLKQVSFDLVNKVGDGTTTAFIGATIFMHTLNDYANQVDFRQTEFLNTLTDITNKIIETLKSSEYVRKIDVTGDFTDIYKIAYVSSNGNSKLAGMIQEIYQKTQNPNIFITLDTGDSLTCEIQSGYKLDCFPINQKGYRNSDDGTYSLSERALIAIFDHNVTYNEHEKIIGALSRYAASKNCTVFIFAPHFDDIMTNIIGTSVNSMLQQGQIPNIMIIQVPLSMNIHRQYLSDLVLLTNAQVFDYGKVRAFNVLVHNQTAKAEDKIEDALLNTDQYNFVEPTDVLDMCLGKTNKIVVGEKYVLIQDYESIVNKTLYENTLDDVKKTFKELKEKANKNTNMLQKDYMDAYQHYTKLFGKMGIIKVGGASELEKHCLKDAVDDSVLACRSAFDHGYIRGLNLATMSVINNMLLDESIEKTPLEHDVLVMLFNTFFNMSMSVLRNKFNDNVTREVTLKKDGEEDKIYVLTNETILSTAVNNNYGYDLVNEQFMPDAECTVVNSTLTDVEILKGIVSILSMMLTSNQFLSINRNYDRTMGRKQQQEAKIREKVETYSAIADMILDKLSERGFSLVNTQNGEYVQKSNKQLSEEMKKFATNSENK